MTDRVSAMRWKVAGSVGLSLIFAVAGHAMAPQSDADEERRVACKARKGIVRPYGDGGTRWFCEQPIADAGKVCSAKSDCIGECTLPDGYVPAQGQKWLTVGACQARTRIGCMSVLRDGLPTHYCID